VGFVCAQLLVSWVAHFRSLLVLFVLVISAMALSILLQFTASDYPCSHILNTRAIVTWQYNHVYTVLIVLKIQWNHLKVGFAFIVFVSLYWQYSLILKSNCFTNILMKCLKELYRDILLTEINVFILSKYYWYMMNCFRLYLKTI
jgi:hypothetical protein